MPEYSTLVTFYGKRKLLRWGAWEGWKADLAAEKRAHPHQTAKDRALLERWAKESPLPKLEKSIIAQRITITRLALAVIPADSQPIKAHFADLGQFWNPEASAALLAP